MRTVWKFPVHWSSGPHAVEIEMPRDSEIVYVGIQDGLITMWATVDIARPRVNRRFVVRGTGWSVEDELSYVGTVIAGAFVWHVFEIL